MHNRPALDLVHLHMMLCSKKCSMSNIFSIMYTNESKDQVQLLKIYLVW